MFGWGKKKRVAKLIEDITVGHAATVLAAIPKRERSFAVVHGVSGLLFDDRDVEACALVEAALVLGVDDEEVLLAGEGAFVRVGDLGRSIELLQRALDVRPASERLLVLLSRRLTEAERAQDTLELVAVARSPSVDLQVEKARALLALDRDDEALPLLEASIAHYEAQMRRVGPGDDSTFYHRCQEARALFDGAYALRHGPEAVIAASTNIRNLIVSGNNYRLLAESLMIEVTCRPSSTSMEPPEDTLARLGKKHHPTDTASTHALRGSAWLRHGKLGAARKAFELACEVDPKHFAGYRGLAAVCDFETQDLFQRAARLEVLPCPKALPIVVPDFEALTEVEKAIVVTSLHPLRGALTLLRARSARIHLLPIDVRTVDLPQWKADSGQRLHDDLRAMDTLGGVASSEHYLAAARAEDLWDIASPNGFVFGHEFAHLAYFVMPDQAPVRELYVRALEIPYVASSYQMKDEHEFFACAYQDYLRARYNLPTFREPDDGGIWKGLVAMFDSLSKQDPWMGT